MREPTRDDVPDALWNPASIQRGRDGSGTLDREQAGDLADEERVAFTVLVYRLGQLRGRDRGRRELQVLRDLILAQAGKREPTCPGLPSHLGEHLRQRRSGDRVDVAVRADQENTGRP